MWSIVGENHGVDGPGLSTGRLADWPRRCPAVDSGRRPQDIGRHRQRRESSGLERWGTRLATSGFSGLRV